jgi:3-oxoacyl-[acyl-carrier protein] reductase
MSLTIDLDGRRALVTGGGQGIGRSIALTLAEAGASVVVNDIRAEVAESVVDEISAAGGTAAALPFDVSSWAAVSGALDSEPIDILVNNAGNAGSEGFGSLCNFAESDPEEWARYFSVNLFGTMHCTRAVLPKMTESGWGRVVTIVSDAARVGDAKLGPYAAAKAGAAGLSRSVAREVGRHGITVNCISLGTIETPVYEHEPTAEQLAAIVRPYVVRRRGRPEEVAHLVAYLASPFAEWITGQTYALNGGYSFSL